VSSLSVIYSVTSRCGLPSGLALTVDVCCTSQWPAMPFSFSHAGTVITLTLLLQGVSKGHRL